MGIGSAKCCNMHKRQQDTQQAIRGSTTEHRRSSQMCLLGRGGPQECSDPSSLLQSGLLNSQAAGKSFLACCNKNALMVPCTLVARIDPVTGHIDV